MRELTQEEFLTIFKDKSDHPAQALARHFVDDNGQMVTEIYEKPVRYNNNGQWQDIDPTIEYDPTSDPLGKVYGKNVKKAKHNLRWFDNKVRFGLAKGVYLDYALPGTPVFDDLTSIITDGDITYRHTSVPEGVKLDIILQSAVQSSFSFPTQLTAVTATVEKNSLLYVETLTGQIVGRIPSPYAVDAKGKYGEVTLSYDGNSVVFTVDSAWLNDQARAFPVTVDPTTEITIQPDAAAGKDAYVVELTGSGFGTDTTLKVGTDISEGNTYFRSYLQFSTASIPANVTILSAQLQRYKSGGSATFTEYLHKVTATWDEATITVANQPSFEGTATTSLSVNGTNSVWIAMTITALVQGWYNGSITNYGVAIKSAEGAGYNEHWYHSSDYATASLRPKLVVTYVTQPTISISTPNGTKTTPTTINNDLTPPLTHAYSDSDGDTQAKAQHRVFDEDSNLIFDSGLVANTNLTTSVGPNKLVYGVKYFWDLMVESSDGGQSARTATGDSANCWFVLAMSAPTGLTATADVDDAAVDLAWNAHASEGLAGYNVYRDGEKINTSLVTTNSYNDDAPLSGTEHSYTVKAVSTSGYESAASSADTATCTYTSRWFGSIEVVWDRQNGLPLTGEHDAVVKHYIGKRYPSVFRKNKSVGQNLSFLIEGETSFQAFISVPVGHGELNRPPDGTQNR